MKIANKNKTHCKYGHPFNKENTVWVRNGKHRRCKICNNILDLKHRKLMNTKQMRLKILNFVKKLKSEGKGTRICGICKKEKSLDEFYKDYKNKLGYSPYCKICHSLDQKKRYLKYKKSILEKVRFRSFGITQTDYVKILHFQNNCCAICKINKPTHGKKKFSIDHDHKTGKVRGLLCGKCNSALGLFLDNLNIIKRAVKYLKRNK